MRQSTKRLTSSLLALSLFVGGFLVFFSFVVPAYQEIVRLRGEEASKNAFAANQASVVDAAKKLIALYESGQEDSALVSLALPLAPEAAEAIGTLNGIATLNRLIPSGFGAQIEEPQIQAIGAASDVPVPTLETVPLGVVALNADFVGTYTDFKNFLRNIETNVRLMDITSIQLNPVGQIADFYRYSVSLKAYYQFQVKAKPKVAQ